MIGFLRACVFPYRLLSLGLLIFLLFPGQPAPAQPGSAGMIPVPFALEELERLHDIRIFFEPAWFANDSISRDVLSMPLDDAMGAILSGRQVISTPFHDHLILLPREESVTYLEQSADDRRLIGNPFEFGKYGRASVSGKVVDGQTGEELVGVLVYVEDLATGTTTDVDGDYSLDLPVGEHELKVTYVGYEPYQVDINLVSPGELPILLMSESRMLDVVTITARRRDSNVSQTQMSLIRMDAQALSQLPTTMGERDIIQSLTLLPGIQSVGEFGTGFHVRGGSADQNLILLEGVPLFNSSHLFGLTSLVNPDMVNEVSLTKAGIPAKFGERSASVMDIRLGGRNSDEFSVNGGLGLLSSRLSIQTPLPVEGGYALFGGRSSYSNEFLHRMPDEDLMNSSARFYDFTGLVVTPVRKNHNITLFGYLSRDGFAFSDNMDYDYGSRLGSFRWNAVFLQKFLSTLLIGHSDYTYQVTGTSKLNPNNAFDLDSKIRYNNIRWNINYYHTPENTIEAGVNAMRYVLDPGSMSPSGSESTVANFSLDQEKAVELAAYISGNFRISPSFAAELGLRFSQYYKLGPGVSNVYEDNQPRSIFNVVDSVSYGMNEVMASYNGLEPRLSLRYQVNPLMSLKLSYSRINQYINVVSNTSVPTPSDVWYLADEFQSPMKSDQLAFGLFRNLFENTLETSLEVYAKQLQHNLEPRNNATILLNPSLETDLLDAKGQSYGAELYLKKLSGSLTGWISYTYSRSFRQTHSRFLEDQINANSAFPANFDQPHNLVVNANYNLTRRWRLGGTFTYNSGRPVTYPESVYVHDGNLITYFSERNKYRLPNYHRLDLSLSFDGSLRKDRRWKSHWTISLVNVYGRKNVYSSFYEKTEPSPSNDYQRYTHYKLYIIGRPLPTITYNFSF
ncbi:MAG: TonB-dependent receptor [Bacteroidales bacterium]